MDHIVNGKINMKYKLYATPK